MQKNDLDHLTKMGFEQNAVYGWHEGPRHHGPFIYENGKYEDIKEPIRSQANGKPFLGGKGKFTDAGTKLPTDY